MFNQYSHDLERACFNIVGSKKLKDPERPDVPEIRYFYNSDKIQAEDLAEHVGFKLHFPEIQANYYEDSRVKPGYLEIWFGP